MTKPVEFPKYEGQTNYPTWAICLVIDNDRNTHEYYRTFARLQGLDFVKEEITQWINQFVEADDSYEKHHEDIVSSWMNYSVRKVNWTIVHEKLAGRETGHESDELTDVAASIMQQSPWKDLVQTEFRFEADDALRDWLLEQVNVWTHSVAARRATESPLTRFCMKAYEICLAVVDWQSVYQDFSEE